MILADANLLSEIAKPYANRDVLEWIVSHFALLHLPTPVLAELRYGCAKLPLSARRRELEQWLEDLVLKLEDRIVSFDRPAAEAHGLMRARLNALGKTCSPSDSYIAAIALSRDCLVATRNVRDFAETGAKIVNPWEG